MLERLRRLLVPVTIFLFVAAGLAYAAVDDVAPVVALDQATDSPEPDAGEGTDDAIPSPADTPEPSDNAEEPTDEPESDDAAETPEASDGRERSTEGCPDGFEGNHGKYVSSTEERPRRDAAKSPCGKPVHEKDDEADEHEQQSDDEVSDLDD